MHLLKFANSSDTAKVHVQMHASQKSVVVRLSSREHFFKHDYTIYFQEIPDSPLVSKALILKAIQSNDKELLFNTLERLA